MHAGGERGLGGGVEAYVVGEMDEPGVVGADATCRFDALREGEMRGMRGEAQGVDDEGTDALECGEGFLGEETGVGDVGEGSEAVTEDGEEAVGDG